MSKGLDIPKPIRTAIGTALGLIILAVILYVLFSTTDILKGSALNNQNINDSLTAIENQGRALVGADGNYYCEPCRSNFWLGFLVGVIVLIVLIALIIGIIWVVNYFMEEGRYNGRI